jgi:hypothetical protein
MDHRLTKLNYPFVKGTVIELTEFYKQGEVQDICKKIKNGSVGLFLEKYFSPYFDDFNYGKGADTSICNLPVECKSRFIGSKEKTSMSIARYSTNSLINLNWSSAHNIANKLQHLFVINYNLLYDIAGNVADHNSILLDSVDFINLTNTEIQADFQICFDSANQELKAFSMQNPIPQLDESMFDFGDVDSTDDSAKWLTFGNTSKLYFEINKESPASVAIRMNYKYLSSLKKSVTNLQDLLRNPCFSVAA